MELKSQVAGKRLRSYLRVTFFMIRKGLISKRKLVMDMNLMMKRGKIMGKTLGNLVFHHHHQPHHRAAPRGRGYGLQEYEFSCTTSPNPVFFHAKRARHNYFPCIGSVAEDDNEQPPTAAAPFLPRIDYSPQSSAVPSQELPLSSSSPLSVRVSEDDVDEEEESGAVLSASNEVDDDAEEFIRRFYEQQRRQSRVALLQYEIEYQEMLARGR